MSKSGLGYVDANLNEVDAWDGASAMVNPGEYHVRCTGVEGGNSQAGNPKMTLTYTILDAVGERAEENKDMVGRTIKQSQSLNLTNDTVKKRLKAILNALIGGPDERGGFEPEALIDAEMVIEVVAQSYSRPNPLTQEPEERTSIKVQRERSVEDYFGAAEPEPAPAPAPSANNRPPAANRGRRTPPAARQ